MDAKFFVIDNVDKDCFVNFVNMAREKKITAQTIVRAIRSKNSFGTKTIRLEIWREYDRFDTLTASNNSYPIGFNIGWTMGENYVSYHTDRSISDRNGMLLITDSLLIDEDFREMVKTISKKVAGIDIKFD